MTDYPVTLMPGDHRIVIVGGPMAGKSTLAQQLQPGHTIFCADPRSKVRQPAPEVTYLPEGLDWSDTSQYVVENWLGMPGPWVLEGQAMARALRKQLDRSGPLPDRILVLPTYHPQAYVASMQRRLVVQVMQEWDQIQPRLASISQELRIEEPSASSPLDGVEELARQLASLRPEQGRSTPGAGL